MCIPEPSVASPELLEVLAEDSFDSFTSKADDSDSKQFKGRAKHTKAHTVEPDDNTGEVDRGWSFLSDLSNDGNGDSESQMSSDIDELALQNGGILSPSEDFLRCQEE